MVQHIVFWNFNEEARREGTQKVAEDLKARFLALPGQIPGLVSIHYGVNYKEGGHNAALCCEFENRAAEKAYQEHPAHLAIKKTVHQYFHERTFVDFED